MWFVWGCNANGRSRKFRSLAELTRLAGREKVLLIMAHPYWCGAPSLRYLRAGPFAGVEVYNTVCDALNRQGLFRSPLGRPA